MSNKSHSKNERLKLYPHISERQYKLLGIYNWEEKELKKYRRLSNVLITRSGVCLKNLIPIRNTFYRKRKVALKAMIRAYGSWAKRGAKQIDEDCQYAIIHMPFANYYHWITEAIPRLEPLLPLKDELTILIPYHEPIPSFYKQSLNLCGFFKHKIIPKGENVWCKSVTVPDAPNRPNEVCAKSINFIRDSFRVNKPKGEGVEKIYISREDASRRKVDNEEILQTILKDYGFRVLHASNLSFNEQIDTMSRCRVLIGQHGAGLTNMVFMPKESSIIELYIDPRQIKSGISSIKKSLNPAYAHLAKQCGHVYHCILSKPSANSIGESPWSANIYVEMLELERKLKQIFESI